MTLMTHPFNSTRSETIMAEGGIDEASIQFNTYRDNTFSCQSNCNSVLFHSIRWLKEALMKHPFNSTLTEIIHSFGILIVILYYFIQSDGFDEASIQFNTYRDNTFIWHSNCNSVLFHSIRWLKEALMKHPFNSTLTEIIHSFGILIVILYYFIQSDGFDEASIQFNTYRDNTFIWHSNCNSVLFHSIRWLKEALMKHPFNSTLTEIIHSFGILIVILYYSIQSDG
ncbi:uncharacterized protein [Rhodnius prolixus]|uniref:uncharacterized protein n=1 Tax=Rhodnius prolixus TaxID=13249 RepID=UPI003D18C75C